MLQADLHCTPTSLTGIRIFEDLLRPECPSPSSLSTSSLQSHLGAYQVCGSRQYQRLLKHEAPPLPLSRAVFLYPTSTPQPDFLPSTNEPRPFGTADSRVFEPARLQSVAKAMAKTRATAAARRAETVAVLLGRITTVCQTRATASYSWDSCLRGAVGRRKCRLESDGREAHAPGIAS